MSDEVSAERAQEIAQNAQTGLDEDIDTDQWSNTTVRDLARTVLALHSREAMLNAQLAPLCELHDAVWSAARAAGVTGAGATPETLLDAVRAQARREGAEAMQEAAARLCADAAGGEYSFAVSATPHDEEHAAQYAARASALRQSSRAIAALPLPDAEVSR